MHEATQIIPRSKLFRGQHRNTKHKSTKITLETTSTKTIPLISRYPLHGTSVPLQAWRQTIPWKRSKVCQFRSKDSNPHRELYLEEARDKA